MNRVTLCARTTKELELKTTENGRKYVNFSLAIEQAKDRTDFVNCTAWGKTAEFMCNYMKEKGTRILCEGHLVVNKYEKDGVKHQVIGVVADRVEFADGRKQ
jgi:single-strand DNA-binding protein